MQAPQREGAVKGAPPQVSAEEFKRNLSKLEIILAREANEDCIEGIEPPPIGASAEEFKRNLSKLEIILAMEANEDCIEPSPIGAMAWFNIKKRLAEEAKHAKHEIEDELMDTFSQMVASRHDGLLTKDLLVKAHGADFKLWAKLDTVGAGTVVMDQFVAYMLGQYDTRQAKHKDGGEKYIKAICFTFRRGLKTKEQIAAEEAALQAIFNELIEKAEGVYNLLVQKDATPDAQGQPTLRKLELTECVGDDGRFVGLYDEIDKAKVGTISIDRFLEYCRERHNTMEAATVDTGKAWLENLLSTLYSACMSNAERERAAREAELHLEEITVEIEQTFTMIAQQNPIDDLVREQDLIAAQGGDFKLFSKISMGAQAITMENFCTYLLHTREAREKKNQGKGDAWVATLTHTLRRGCKSDDELAAEHAAMRVRLNNLLEDVGAVFRLLVRQEPSDEVLRKPILLAAQPQDPDLFERIDKEGTGAVVVEDFLAFFRSTHDTMEKAAVDSGHIWLEDLVTSLQVNVMSAAEKAAQEAARSVELEELIEEVEAVFHLVASFRGESEQLTRPVLLEVQGGDFKLFEKIETAAKGFIEREDWLAYFRLAHAAREEKNQGKGDAWVRTLCYTLRRKCKSPEEIVEETATRLAARESLMVGVAQLHALVGDSDRLVRKPALVDAYPIDPSLFEHIGEGKEEAINLERWLAFFRSTHDTMEASKPGEGHCWVDNLVGMIRSACLDATQLEAEEMVRQLEAEALLEEAGGIFLLVARYTGDGDVESVSHADLLAVQGFETKLFDKIAEGSQVITAQVWASYMERMRAAKEVKKTGAGNRWLRSMSYSLGRKCRSEAEIEAEKALRATKMTAQLDLLARIHHMMEPLAPLPEPGLLSKEALLAVKPYEPDLYERVLGLGLFTVPRGGSDPVPLGVSLEAWQAYFEKQSSLLENQHVGDGLEWLIDQAHTLRLTACGAEELAEELAALAALVEALRSEADAIFDLLVAGGGGRGLRKEQLVAVQGADYGLWAKMDPEGTGVVGTEQWSGFLLGAFEAKNKIRFGKGEAWLRNLFYTLQLKLGEMRPPSAPNEPVAPVAAWRASNKPVMFKKLLAMSPLPGMRQSVGIKELRRIVMLMMERELCVCVEVWRYHTEFDRLMQAQHLAGAASTIQAAISGRGLRLQVGPLLNEQPLAAANTIKAGMRGADARMTSMELTTTAIMISSMRLQGGVLGAAARKEFKSAQVGDALLHEAWLMGQVTTAEYIVQCQTY